jgi:hypothetical protein
MKSRTRRFGKGLLFPSPRLGFAGLAAFAITQT